jgi:hypothetical protein
MDDAFSLVASDMPRTRRLSPFGFRVTTAVAIVLTLIVTFGMFVAGQQRAADVRRAAMTAQQEAARRAQAAAAVSDRAAVIVAPTTLGELLDQRARAAATDALAAATQLAAASSLAEVVPATLAAADRDVLFVDAASTAPSIVSVFSGASGWAAAVRGSGRTCYWVALAPSGRPRFGTGSACTGMAALAADRGAW